MKAMTTVMAACILSFHGTVDAQQTGTEEQGSRQGLPATPHQEQAARQITSDLFKQLDEDRDGSVSRQEAQAEPSLSNSWSKYDQNGDETLDPEEFSGFDQSSTSSAEREDLAEVAEGGPTAADMPTTPHQEHAVQGDLIKQLDTDGDGQISQQEAEAEARLSSNWDQFDRNDDGKIDSRELDRFEQ